MPWEASLLSETDHWTFVSRSQQSTVPQQAHCILRKLHGACISTRLQLQVVSACLLALLPPQGLSFPSRPHLLVCHLHLKLLQDLRWEQR